ncbi:hypothetical protein NIES37_39600 [Tolypothrix tenuis PCC 7101]|uniref:Uncharacterized protein n=1 Tax=Tolypothrix tenuis PCC 7101 TaxID=231146 RepID=A0A1Z4N2M5_9CYAN|nr:hypothetical protein NIES37_39600 [Tolypothrix tenuis PCC 7101]BAZ76101.1 hypothetical protein NIES50_46990 [Aulosira laxa NIES-50]
MTHIHTPQTPQNLLAEVLKGKSEEFQRRVLDFAMSCGLSPDDPLFLVLVATGQLEVMLQDAPETLQLLFAMDNQIGIIANEIQKNLALQCELCAMPQIEKSDYLKQVSIHLAKVLQRYQQGKLKIPEQIIQQIQQLAPASINYLSATEEQKKLNLLKKVLKDCVAELGNELQVAADGPKSALRPDKSIIQYCQAITAYKEVAWLSDKKNIEAFTNRGMKSNGYSPIDLMIQQTNQIFEQNQITARPIEQFRNLYPGVEFNQLHKEKAQEIKSDYNSLIKQRLELESRNKFESGPYIVITSPTSGRKLEITNLVEFAPAKNPDFWIADKLTIRIKERTPSKSMPHSLKATVKFNNVDGQEIDMTIGTVSLKSMQQYDLKPGMSIKQGKVEFHFGISDGMIDALKQQAKEYIESIINSTPQAERLQLAAAIHDVSHTEESQNYSGIKRAGVAFAVFPDKIISQLQQLQFNQMRVIGTQFNEYAFQNFQCERVPIKFEDSVHPRDPTKTARWVILEGKTLGTLDARSPHLLAGCEAIAAITSAPSTSFIITSLKNPDHKLQIDSVNQYAFATRQWFGEQVNITLDVRQTQERKAPTVVAYLDNQILGVVNKQSVNFLQGRLAAIGRQLQGFSFVGMLNNAPVSYADIVIDSSSVKFPEITVGEHENNSAVATVLFFSSSIDSQLQAKTEQVLCNMLRRAVDRAVERGYDTVRFVDVSLHSDKSSQNQRTIEMLATERKNIKVEFKGAASLEDAIALLREPDDIVIGICSPKTIGIIDFASNHRKAIAAYIPETGKFERRNLPSIQPNVVAANNDIERDGSY